MAQIFVNPTQYITRFGKLETGRLLANAGIIEASDLLSDYESAMYSEGVLITAVSDKLAQVIAEAQSSIEGFIYETVSIPLTIDSIELTSAEIETKAPLLFFICLDISRWILHDEDIVSMQDSSNKSSVQLRYEIAKAKLEGIAKGKIDLPNIDQAGALEDGILWVI